MRSKIYISLSVHQLLKKVVLFNENSKKEIYMYTLRTSTAFSWKLLKLAKSSQDKNELYI